MVSASDNSSKDGNPFVVVKDLKKSFPMTGSRRLAVVDVPSFSFVAGYQLAIFGGSGSGKSTFLNLMAGILKTDSGNITIGNIDLSILSEADRDQVRARLIGCVFQSFHLLQGCTALENLLVAMSVCGHADKAKARDLLSMVGMSEKENFLPSQLSVGQQQRVGIARALSNNPQLILADEPTGSLDPENASQSIDLLRSLCKERGCALITVSHDSSIVDRFDSSLKWEDLNQVVNTSHEP